MGVSVGHRPGPERTRALLETIAGGEAGRRLRAQVAGWNTDASPEQIEDAFQEACARVERSCRGQVEGEVYNWLRTTTHREIAHQRRRWERERVADVSVEELEVAEHRTPPADVTAIRREERAEITRVTKVVLDQLSDRQRDVAALHVRDLPRREIAEHLRLSQRVVKRSMEQILAIGRDELVRLAGDGCEAGEGLVARFAFGLAGARDARLAQLHLATCPQCGAMYERLDLWREKVAAVLPVPAVAGAHGHVVERVVHASTEILPGSGTPAAESPVGLRRHVGDLVAHVREHATVAYSRLVDPTPLAGVRPGAVAAAVAGCLAVGGGATYCVKQGADPLPALTGVAAPKDEHHKPKPRLKRARVAQAPAPAVVTPTATSSPPPVQQQQPTPQATATPTTPAAPPPAPQDEFEPTSPNPTTSASPTSASSNTRKAAPAPAGGPGEFDGP